MDNEEPDSARHPIGVVAERTGLSQEVLRVWERRYAAVEPERTESGQRLYTDADVERLRLLRRATQAGRSIGMVARLPLEELVRVVRSDDEAGAQRPDGAEVMAVADLDAALAHARRLDAAGLEALLRRTSAVYGVPLFLERVVTPLMRRIGDEWHAGRLSPAHEHLATATVERVLAGVLSTLSELDDAPVFLVATPAGERHEVGALLAAAAAAAEGWRVVYLGADLPAEEIGAAAVSAGARAVGVSVVLAESPSRTAAELRRLRELLPASVPLLVGGGGAAAVIQEGTVPVQDLDGLRAALRRLHGW